MSKKTITSTVTMARPNDNEVDLFYKLYHAAQRVEDRWHHNTVGPIADELSHCPSLTRQEKMFLLRAWQVLVDGIGGFGRFMGAFDTYVYNMQDPAVDHVAYKPSLIQLFGDAELLPVVIEAYQEALAALEEKDRRIAELEISETQLITARDNTEAALNDMYRAVMGESPEWSNMFQYADAVEEVEAHNAELEQRLQQPIATDKGMAIITEAIGAHGYIVGCLQRNRSDLALEEALKWVAVFSQAAQAEPDEIDKFVDQVCGDKPADHQQ